ncbi:MAG: DUF1571 domain-containing protein [Aureliella sp.]
MKPADRRKFLSLSALLGTSALASTAFAQERPGSATEPVARISKNTPSAPRVERGHPLDPALKIAYSSLENSRKNIRDYTAILIKRERVGGTLGEYEYMGVKVRNRKMSGGRITAPLSVYMAFLKPASVKGREVIYVENQNGGKLVAHEGGMKGRFLPTVELDPNGMMAMRGQRYPITEVGIENLVAKLIEKGERDRQRGECDVKFVQGVKVGGRECTVLTVEHPVKRSYFDFYRAEIFIDNEYQIPVRYCAYDWPTVQGSKGEIMEEYTYQNVKLNVGLTDKDFDRNNPRYKF